VLDGDLIAEEPGRACAGVGDQRLAGRQFQPEFVTQESCQPLLDLLGLGLGSGEPEQMVICVSAVPQSPVTGIARVGAGQAGHLPP
jgi:hypothetical protein